MANVPSVYESLRLKSPDDRMKCVAELGDSLRGFVSKATGEFYALLAGQNAARSAQEKYSELFETQQSISSSNGVALEGLND